MAKAVLGIVLALLLALPLSVVSADRSTPAWQQLTAEQQRILAPIQGEWDSLDTLHKRKWLGIAQRYPKMSADEQQRLQRRMKEWVSLTPEQRRAARDKYREFEQLAPEDRQAMRNKWEKYKQEQAAKEAAAKAAEADDGTKTAETAPADGGTATGLRPQ